MPWTLLPRYLNFVSPLEFGTDTGPCHQMASKWSAIIENSVSGHSAVIDVNMWLGKATLDACVLVLSFGKDVLWAAG